MTFYNHCSSCRRPINHLPPSLVRRLCDHRGNALRIGLVCALLLLSSQLRAQSYVLQHDAVSGKLVLVDDPALPGLTAIELKATVDFFTGPTPPWLSGWFDVHRTTKLFHLQPSGFSNLDFGNIVTTGLATATFADGLCVDGARQGGGRIGPVELQAIPTGQRYDVTCDAIEPPDLPDDRDDGGSGDHGVPPNPNISPPLTAVHIERDVELPIIDHVVEGVNPFVSDAAASLSGFGDTIEIQQLVQIPPTPANRRFDLEIATAAVLLLGLDNAADQPFDWMQDASLTGLAPFYDTNIDVQLDMDQDGLAELEYSWWATIMPPGRFHLPTKESNGHVLIATMSLTPLPEPSVPSNIVFAIVAVVCLRTRRDRK